MAWRDDSEEIDAGLRQQMPALTRWLGLGNPTKQHANGSWRFGKSGGLSVKVSGKDAGAWIDFSTGEKGTPIGLIRRERGGEVRHAFDAARSFLDMEVHPSRVASSPFKFLEEWIGPDRAICFSPDMAAIGNGRDGAQDDGPAAVAAREAAAARRRADAEARRAADAIKEQRDREQKRDLARNGWKGAGQIETTHAAAYLNARGLPVIPDGGALRFAPEVYDSKTKKMLPCMVALVAEHDGAFCAIHRTFLHRVRPEKATEAVGGGRALLGGPGTGGMWLTKHRGPRLYVCEGIETGLSILRADPGAAVVAAGSAPVLRKIVLPPEAREVVILVDDDDEKKGSRAGPDAARAAAARWTAEGRTVFLAWPRPSKGGGYDFNDLLRDGGPHAVRAALDAAEPFASDADAEACRRVVEMFQRAEADGPRLTRRAVSGAAPLYEPETQDRIADAEPALRAIMRDAVREGVRWAVFHDLRRHALEVGIGMAARERPDLAKARYARRGDPDRAAFRSLAAKHVRERGRIWRAALASAGWAKPDAEPAPRVLRAVAGAGKTHTLFEALAKAVNEVPYGVPCHVAVLAPDHSLTAQMAKMAAAAGLRVVVLAGRGQKGEGGSPLCLRAAVADSLVRKGLSVSRDLCGRIGEEAACPHRATCGYYMQARDVPSRAVLIGTHDALVAPHAEMSGGVALPAFVVTDEAVTQKVVGDPVKVSRAALRGASLRSHLQ